MGLVVTAEPQRRAFWGAGIELKLEGDRAVFQGPGEGCFKQKEQRP